MRQLPSLFQSWIHSREEDTHGITVYRPAGFAFPLSRGRDGLEFRPDGTVVVMDPGPDDRGRTIMGSWTREAKDSVNVLLGGTSDPRKMTILECTDDILRVRWNA
jgi:hypothetical protein